MNLQSAAIPGSGTPKSGKKYLQNPPIRWPIHPHPKITTGIYGIERKFEWEWRDWTWIEEPFWWPASFSTCKGNVQLKFRAWVLAHHAYCSMLFFPLDVVLYPTYIFFPHWSGFMEQFIYEATVICSLNKWRGKFWVIRRLNVSKYCEKEGIIRIQLLQYAVLSNIFFSFFFFVNFFFIFLHKH